MNYYPAVAHTFILRELHALDPARVEPFRVATNPVSAAGLLTDLERDEFARTYNIQNQPKAKLAWLLATTIGRHPIGFLKALRTAVTAAGTDVKLAVWHVLYLLEAAVLVRYCRRNGITHIHAHLGHPPATVAWFAAELGRHCYPGDGPWSWSATIHGWHEFVNEKESTLAHKVAASTFLVGISDFTRSQLMRIGKPEHWHKLHVVRCGLDLGRHPFVDGRTPYRYGIDGVADLAPPTLVMTARLSPEKGHLVLLEAMHLLAQRGSIVRARLIGGGDFRPVIERAIVELGLTDQVDLVGPLDQDQVRAEVGRAHGFVLPTFAEGLPVVIMEAMAAGTPVVTTPISGIPELVVDGSTGYLASPGRADQLADAIDRLFADAEQAHAVVKAARAAVEERHDVRVNVQRLEALFVDLPRLRAAADRPGAMTSAALQQGTT
jgi:glycosyltransferase involved in cell wall biosynthesis